MPSISKESDHYLNAIEVEESYSQCGTDDEGNIYINNTLHDLGMHHEKIAWVDGAADDIIEMYKILVDYRDNVSKSHLLEKITYNRFLEFVAEHSYKY